MSPLLKTVTLRVTFKHTNLGRDTNIHSMVPGSTKGPLEGLDHEFKRTPVNLDVCFSSARPRSPSKDTAEAELDLAGAGVSPMTTKTTKNQGIRRVCKRMTLIITMELG